MYESYLNFAIELAKDAGQYILPHAGKAGQQTSKSAKDFVTEMDLKVEKRILDRIKETYPEHGIYSEEAGVFDGTGDFQWVIDPIDGTVNYSVGVPLYGVSIALTYKDEPVVAVISLPALGEMYWASKGKGAFLDGQPLQVRNSSLSESFISVGDFAKDGNKESNQERLLMLETIVNDVYRIRMVGSAAVTLAYIAAGRLDAAIYLDPNWYDVAAGQLLVAEAGGIKTAGGKYTVYGSRKAAVELMDLLGVLRSSETLK